MPARRIGVFGHVGNKNLGDEATIAATIQNIRRWYPNAEIVGFTSNPKDTEECHGIPAVPLRRLERRRPSAPQLRGESQSRADATVRSRIWTKLVIALKKIPPLFAVLKGIQRSLQIFWGCIQEVGFLVQCYWNLRGIDCLFIAGSQQLNDYNGGPWAFPYTLYKWSVIARLTGTKVAFVSVGAGPVESRFGKWMIRKSLALAEYHSYRGESSKRFVEQLGVQGENPVFPDLVYSLQVETNSRASALCASSRIVGINPLPYFDERYWPESDARIYDAYVQQIASFAQWVIGRGYSVLFFPTQLRADPLVIEDIRRVMASTGADGSQDKILDCPLHSIHDLVSAISATDLVVATRFHGIVIAFALQKPVLGIAYHKKNVDLMDQMGQKEYVVDINSLSPALLQEKFMRLEAKRESSEKVIGQRLELMKGALDQQYSRLVRLLDQKSE
jgi:polysaccharide pyruvyl transferase WcaK-like protein